MVSIWSAIVSVSNLLATSDGLFDHSSPIVVSILKGKLVQVFLLLVHRLKDIAQFGAVVVHEVGVHHPLCHDMSLKYLLSQQVGVDVRYVVVLVGNAFPRQGCFQIVSFLNQSAIFSDNVFFYTVSLVCQILMLFPRSPMSLPGVVAKVGRSRTS